VHVVARTLAAAGICASGILFAQTSTRMGAHGSAQHATDMVDGQVEAVDKTARNITLRHAEIRNVKMPAMTMVFNVKEPALLDKVKAGDKVKFKVEAIAGAPTVTVIEVVK